MNANKKKTQRVDTRTHHGHVDHLQHVRPGHLEHLTAVQKAPRLRQEEQHVTPRLLLQVADGQRLLDPVLVQPLVVIPILLDALALGVLDQGDAVP